MPSTWGCPGLARPDAALSRGARSYGCWDLLGSYKCQDSEPGFCAVSLGEALGLGSLDNLTESVYLESSILCAFVIVEFRAKETFCKEEKMFSGSCPPKDFFFS